MFQKKLVLSMAVFAFLEKSFFFSLHGCLSLSCKTVHLRSHNSRLKTGSNHFVAPNELLCKRSLIIFLSVFVPIMFVFVNNKVLPDMHIKCLAEWQVRNFVVQVLLALTLVISDNPLICKWELWLYGEIIYIWDTQTFIINIGLKAHW